MAALVAVAEGRRSRHAFLVNRAARLCVPVARALALLAFAGWAWRTRGDLRLAVNVAAAVLITTCSVGLAPAVPAVTAAASGRPFRRGVFVEDGTGPERLARVDTVVLGRTGTLTLGAPEPRGLGAHRPEDLAVALALAQGYDLHLVASDVAPAVEALAARLGVPAWTARTTPNDKAAHVARLAREGRRVPMVGHGPNDTAALAEALVSISPASGFDAASVAEALMTDCRSVRRIRENFAASVLYNVAATAMSLSSATVTMSALRVRWLKGADEHPLAFAAPPLLGPERATDVPGAAPEAREGQDEAQAPVSADRTKTPARPPSRPAWARGWPTGWRR